MTQIEALLEFLGEAVTPFHAVAAMSRRLRDAGFEEIERFDPAAMTAGRGYYMTRQGSSLIAMRAAQGRLDAGLRLVGAHTDSPNLSVKPNPVKGRDGCVQLGVDVYGGALLNPWFDRDLAIAGRVTLLSASGELCSTLFDSRRPVAVVPSLAIHLDRDANKQRSINPQKDVVPLVMLGDPQQFDFKAWLAESLTTQGPMLMDALTALVPEPQSNQQLRTDSWMLSVDNAHAVHPNYADKHDDQHSPRLGGGPVIKINRNQRYATDSEGAARLRLLAERAEVDVQAFVMRADLACGSTIGPITATETGIATTDLGVPTLAMHSIRELACTADIPQLVSLLTAFYRRLA